MFDRNIIEDALTSNRPQPREIAHYTKITCLPSLISAQASSTNRGWSSAWASPVQLLNDRNELLLGLDILSYCANRAPKSSLQVIALIESLGNLQGSLVTDAFQMSFSGATDDLGQWRGYANNGMGCSIFTDVGFVHQIADVSGWIIYDRSRQVRFANRVLDGIRGIRDNDILTKHLVSAASMMKDPAFRGEKEYRLLVFPDPSAVNFRDVADRLVPYTDFLSVTKACP